MCPGRVGVIHVHRRRHLPTGCAVTSAFFDDLSEVLDRAAGYRDPVYIVGDLNVRLDHVNDANSRQLTDLLAAHGFSVRETETTHARDGIRHDAI